MNALILLSCLGLVALFAEIFNFKKALFPIVLAGVAITFIVNTLDWNRPSIHFNMMYFDNYAVAFTGVILSIAFLWFLMAQSYFKEEANLTDHFALILFALAGAVIMVSYSNMCMLFLGIEILSISMYILAGSNKSSLASNEAAMKYFLMGAFATGFLLFGIVLIYGATASFDLPMIGKYVAANPANISGLFYAGVLLILIGLSFKISAAPFHFWAPDVYQGAPTVITAFMATIVKTAAFAAFFRLFFSCFVSISGVWSDVIWCITLLTLIIGNVTAVYQTSVKRMLAYSSVAHAGYLLLAILAMNKISASSILYYSAAYSIATIAAFTVLYIIMRQKEDDSINAFNGLGKTNPLISGIMTIAMLSLAGIPPMAGFFAKYYIFNAALQNDHLGIVIIAVMASLVGVYYYFKIIIALYFKEDSSSTSLEIPPTLKLVLVITAILMLVIGLFPDFIIGLL